jgi:hypothetical protein
MIACKEALSGASYITAVSVLDLPIGPKIRRDADVAGIDCVDNDRRFRLGALQYARLAVGPVWPKNTYALLWLGRSP